MITRSLALSPRTVVSAAEPSSEGPVGFVTGLVERLGGPGAGLAMALENLFPPLPSEVILPLAGFAAAPGPDESGRRDLLDHPRLGGRGLALYWIGAALGRDRMRAIAARLPLVKLSDVERTEAWFLKHGVKAVFFGRMIPIFRSLISIPAGVERMPMLTFLLFTTLGSLIWNTTFVLAGFLLGDNWHVVEEYVGTFQKVVIVVCVAAAGWFVVNRVRRARAARADTPAVDVPPGDAAGGSEPGEGTTYRRGPSTGVASGDAAPTDPGRPSAVLSNRTSTG